MKRHVLIAIFVFGTFFQSTAAFADAATEAATAADPVAEKRLQALSAELRCLVCQNQTIADSNADLAVDLRRIVRSQILEGKSDREIKEYLVADFMVARYGDFVLYRPPVKGITLLLWGGPVGLMLLGLFALQRYLRRRATRINAEDKPLSADESSRADALLKEIDRK